MTSLTIKTVALSQGKRDTDIVTLSIRVTLNRISRYRKTIYQVPLIYWNGNEITKGFPNYNTINADLQYQVSIIKKHLYAIEEASTLTIRDIEQYLAHGEVLKDHSFSRLVIDYINLMVGTGRKTPGTIRNYNKQLERIHEYAGKADIQFEEINKEFLQGYELWLRDRGCAGSTIWDLLTKFVGKFHRIARDTWPDYTHNPFLGYQKPPSPRASNKAYLTLQELDSLEKELVNMKPTDQLITNYFLLECYSGIRHSDWTRFQIESLSENNALKLSALKNGEPIYLSLAKRPRLKAVLARLKPYSHTLQYTNERLKVIGAMAGIRKNLSTHVGRHTFAVLSAEMGYSKEWLAQMMGVTTGSVEWYYKVTRLKIKDEEDRLGGL